jgi:hypothetical protein
MKSVARWQLAFIFGIGTLLLSSAVAFGASLFLTIVGALAVSIGVVNSLLSQPSATSRNPLLSILQRALNVSSFLKAATILVILIATILSVYGGWARYSDYKERQKVTIEGVVLTAAGDPADRATVTLLLKRGNQDTVSTLGKFSFTKLDLSNEGTNSFKIQARLGSREGEAEVDLSKGPPENLVIKLSPGDPPFRVTYFLLERQAIDFLLQGKVDNNWEAKLAGQPFIVPDRVYKSLSGLVNSFSKTLGTETPSYGFYKEENGVRTDTQSLPIGETPIKSFFVGTSEGEVVHLDAAVPGLLNSLLDNNQHWRLFINPTTNQDLPYPLVFRKYVDRSDLTLLSQASVGKFYSYITREYMPPDFGYVEISLSGICSDDPPWYSYAKYVGRLLRLRVAVVENITNEPIKLGRFTLRENDAEGLRSQDQNRAQLEKIPLAQSGLFPMEMLKPSEKLVIPMEMDLGIDKDEERNVLVTAGTRPDLVSRIRNTGQFFFAVPETVSPGAGVNIPGSTLDDMFRRSDQMVTLDREYVLGPSLMVENLEVDRVEFPFRQFDPSRIVIFEDTATGSCPFVYTYSKQSKTWRNEGVILRARIGQEKESLDEKLLTEFDGRVRIVEKEHEDSFIDSVYLRVTYDNGEEATFYPRNKQLRAADGNRTILRQGDELSLFFDIPRSTGIRKFVLGAVGYYIPYLGSARSTSHSTKKHAIRLSKTSLRAFSLAATSSVRDGL